MKLDTLIDEKKILKTKCFDAANNGSPMYRGVSGKPNVPFIGTIRSDRKTLHSPPLMTALFDTFMEFLGYPHRKANTLSVSVDEEQADTYGASTYRVFPFDGSEYLYSKNHDDLITIGKMILKTYKSSPFFDKLFEQLVQQHGFDHRDAEILSIHFERNKFTLEQMQLPQFYAKYGKYLDALIGLKRTKSCRFIDASGEILVYGNQYLAIPHSEREDYNPDQLSAP